MAIKKSVPSRLFDVFNVLLLSLITLIALYPFLYVVFVSFSNANEYAAYTGIVFLCQVGTKKFLRFYKPFIGG